MVKYRKIETGYYDVYCNGQCIGWVVQDAPNVWRSVDTWVRASFEARTRECASKMLAYYRGVSE